MQIISSVNGVRKPAMTATDNEDGGGDGEEDADDDDEYGGGGESTVGDCKAASSSSEPGPNDHNERIFRRLMPNYQQKEPTLCELCGYVFAMPVSYHMLITHPGCGHSSGGRGYTSNGTYKSGWSGTCGEGGIAWYLLCEACRSSYTKRVKQAARNAVHVPPAVQWWNRKTAAVVRRGCATASAPGCGAGAADEVCRKPQGLSCRCECQCCNMFRLVICQ